MTSASALLCVLLPVVAAALGLLVGRSRSWAQDWAVLGTGSALVAALAELYGVLRDGAVDSVPFLGTMDLGDGTVLSLDLRADTLSATVSVVVALVACCVQVYSSAYLHGEGTPDAPTRYRPYAATVSMFTAAMMLVVHADDLLLLVIGWEVMGISSYLLVGHHSERASARAAAVKAFLVTRIGDLGVLLAVAVLITDVHTTSISGIIRLAEEGGIGTGTLTLVAVLMLAGVAGKSAQFPLHTWLPDAMEGPSPVSALIHAATMVAAGVYLVARLLPVFLAADAALEIAAVMAAVTMFGAALAAVAQDDFKRLLAYSTISQVSYMLAGVAVATEETGSAPGTFHLLSHATWKALLFLMAGCLAHLVGGSTRMKDYAGLRTVHPGLAVLLGIGLACLAGVPPFGGFWSKEAVLSAAEHSALHGGGVTAWIVLVSGLATALLTGVYSGRAWAVIAMGDPVTGIARPVTEDGETVHHHRLSRRMTGPLVVLAVPSVLMGLVLLRPPEVLEGVEISPVTAVVGTLLALAGLAWSVTAPRRGRADVADLLPDGVRGFLRAGYRLDDVQDALVVRPVKALASVVATGDREVVDGAVRGIVTVTRRGGLALRAAQTGLANGYLVWVFAGAALVGLAGVVLS